jgi:type IV pilus assembly protein PilB
MRLRRQANDESGYSPSYNGATAALEPDLRVLPEDSPRLGDLLLATGSLSPEDLSRALRDQSATGRRLGDLLLAEGAIDERILTYALARQLRIPLADLRHEKPVAEALAYVPPAAAHELGVVPLRLHEGPLLEVAVVDPLDPRLSAFLQQIPVRLVRVFLAPGSEVRAAVNLAYPAIAELDQHITAFTASESTRVEPEPTVLDGDDDAPVIQVVNKIVTQALRDRASDVHIEPVDDRVRVRFRIDGALKEVLNLPSSMGTPLVSRIKIMADMNIVERRRPQDGQFQMTVDGRELDVRVATTVTIWGEKTVLRLLDKSRSLYRLADLGMPDEAHQKYARTVRAPYGMVIVSGPTGSGKTTTLYATLTEINRTDINVMTIEDPVEYVFPSVNQIQINEQADVTFASGLKSILRQDPDVILVGEVRDLETARIAVQSALTGHLVLSSIHATDSVAALFRLLDMGVEPFLVASSISSVVAQRLVRRICRSCAAPYEPSAAELATYEQLDGPPKHRWVRGAGCNLCSDTGFYDRVGVYEVLTVTDEIRHAVVSGSTIADVRKLAIAQGLRSLRQEAMRLVADDLTTIDEVIRNVYVAEASL